MNKSAQGQAFRVTLSSMLLAVMLVLGYIESMLPSPGVPGIKLGLSNSVLIFAVYMLDIPTAYILMSLKVVLSGVLFGGVTTMIYAFSGGLVSLTVMVLCRKVFRLHPIVVSMAGGMFHNVGQVAIAILILHTPSAILGYLGLLMLTGLGCGLLTGLAANQVMHHMKSLHIPTRTGSSSGIAVTLIALVCVLAALAFAWHNMVRISSQPVEILTDPQVTVQDASAPPF